MSLSLRKWDLVILTNKIRLKIVILDMRLKEIDFNFPENLELRRQTLLYYTPSISMFVAGRPGETLK